MRWLDNNLVSYKLTEIFLGNLVVDKTTAYLFIDVGGRGGVAPKLSRSF